MTYPGNPSLPSDVQQRIRSTFDHTLGLAESGNRQEALLGCDFVLRMDPLFEPARRLQERLDKANGPLAIDDLRRLADGPAPVPAATAAPAKHDFFQAAPEPLWPELDGLAPELPELPDLHAGGLTPPQTLRAELDSLLAARRFQEIQNRAAQMATAVTGDLELQRIVALAQERLEAGPYVSKFLLSAREALRTGATAETSRLIEKARALDPTHPGIAELESLSQTAPGKAPGFPAGPSRGPASGTAIPREMQTQPIGSAPRAAAPPRPEAVAPPGPPPGPLPVGGGDSESERRIRQLLDEGQRALDGGDPQAAIDVWSRIFLIDIDHQEAARRIENARRVKAERDRQVEEAYHDGMARLEARDAAGARQAFARVLALQPGHVPSREYLQQLDGGMMPAPPSGGSRPGPAKTATATAIVPVDPAGMARVAGSLAPHVELPRDLVDDPALSDADLKEEILVPPDLDRAAARPAEPRREVRAASSGAHEGRARRLFLVVGSAVLLLVLAVGWFLYQKREQWFPNSRSEEVVAQPAAPNPIPRATKLHDAGKVGIALTQLRRLPPGDPHYKEAQALIARWQAEGLAPGALNTAAGGTAAPGAADNPALAAAGGGAGPAGGGAGEPDRRQKLLAEAQKSFQSGSYLLAAERYEAADKLTRLDAGDASQLALAKQKLIPIQRQVAMFLSHDWEYALPELWRLREREPANQDVNLMIVDSYYDLGVRSLQHGDPKKAAEQFTEAKGLAPDDPEIKRQLLFAETYQERGMDLLYRIYVKYLPIR
jgi:hypothetical protein